MKHNDQTEQDYPTMIVADLLKKLQTRNGKGRVIIHLADTRGRIVEGVLPDEPPEFGVGDDFFNVVFLYGRLIHDYEDKHPKECRGSRGTIETERANQDDPALAGASRDDTLSNEEFLKELEAMDASDKKSQRPDSSVLKAALFDRLREAGVTSVSVEYDGCGDSGCVEGVTAFGVGGDKMTLANDVMELLEEYVYDRLPAGWEINDGSFGEVEFDVHAGQVTFDHSQRITDTHNEQWEE